MLRTSNISHNPQGPRGISVTSIDPKPDHIHAPEQQVPSTPSYHSLRTIYIGADNKIHQRRKQGREQQAPGLASRRAGRWHTTPYPTAAQASLTTTTPASGAERPLLATRDMPGFTRQQARVLSASPLWVSNP